MTKKSLAIRYGIQQFLHFLALGILIPVFVLLQQSKGLDLFEVGTVMAIFGIVVMVLEVPTGSLADIHGRKKIYLIATLFYFLSMSLFIFVASFIGIVMAISVYSVSRALSSGTLDAWFVDEFHKAAPDGNLQKALAIIEVIILVGLGIGSVIGGLLPDIFSSIADGIDLFNQYSGNLLAVLAVIIIQLCYVSVFIREKKPEHTEPKSLSHQLVSSIRFSFSHRTILLLLLTTLMLGIGFSCLETFWQPRVKEIGGSDLPSITFGILSAGYFIAAAIGSLAMIPIAKRFSNHYPRLLTVTRILFGLGFIMLSRQDSLVSFACWYFILFSFNGASSSPHNTLLNNKVASDKRSTILSLSSLSLQVGGSIGALGGGLISEHLGIPITWVTAGSILILSAGFYLAIRED